MPKSVINVIHHINKLNEEKYMIILVSAEKKFDERIQHTS